MIFNESRPTVHAPVAEMPPLLVLTADAASLSARRVHTFPDAASAAAFVGFWFADCEKGFTALWALCAPPENGDAEAVVLVRDERDSSLVHPFAFSSMDDALDLARSEMRSGLHIGRIAIYYAVRVMFRSAAHGLVPTPALPPLSWRLPAPSRLAANDIFVVPMPAESFLSRAFNAARLRRWTWHDAPFAGFGSPRGRF